MEDLEEIGSRLSEHAEMLLTDDDYLQLIDNIKTIEPNFPRIRSEIKLKQILYSFLDFETFVIGDTDIEDTEITTPYNQSLNMLNSILIHSSVRVVPNGTDYEIVIVR